MTGTQVLIGVIGVIVALGSAVVGVIIGFYKCRADLSEQYVSKDDCHECSVKAEIVRLSKNMESATAELEAGHKTFTIIKVSLAVIADEMKVKDKIQSMLKSMGITET